jgi:hypothetical protein
MRVAANEASAALNQKIITAYGWGDEDIEWLSPVASDEYAEYYDEAFLELLGIADLKVPLKDFWPSSGPRWDGLARTASGKIILVEAKAYIEEAVDYCSKAGPASLAKINESLGNAKEAFRATSDAPWEAPFYQYANRLAHLYFLRELNGIDAYMLFLNFADAPDVPDPCSQEQWEGSTRLINKCLGLGKHPYSNAVATVVWSVPDLLSDL